MCPEETAHKKSHSVFTERRWGQLKRFICAALFFALQFTWGIIQNAAGLLIFLFLVVFERRRPAVFRRAVVTPWRFEGCMSLGIFIFLGSCADGPEDPLVVHEYGHTVQSVILGPLYLPLIGLPSLIWAGIFRSRRLRRRIRKPGRPQEKDQATGQRPKIKRRRRINYTEFYTEKWANRLGRKVTGRRPPEW